MLTLIVPVRNWPTERIVLCIESFIHLKSTSLSEIIVVDFGSDVPVILPKFPFPSVKVMRLEAIEWSLAEAINAGVAGAKNGLIAKTDADILIGPSSRDEFDRTVHRLLAREYGLAVSQATDLNEMLDPTEASVAVREGRAADLGRIRPKWGQGGLVFFTRADWDAIGGFDSRFTGWGNEDNDFAERFRRSGKRIYWTNRDKLAIFHVWHPPSFAATGVLKHRQKNQAIASTDKSTLRSISFRHSDFAKVAPNVLRNHSPLVTLGIATTARPNRDRMILEAINSFRGQIDNDFEVLVVENGSDPEATASLHRNLELVSWTDRVAMEVLSDGSIPAARNVISASARGRYICVVDDDDIALPNRLADHLKVFETDGMVHGSHGGWIDFDESTGVIERNSGKERLAATLLKGTGKITAHPASLYRTDVMRAVPYDEAFALGSDLDLALRMAVLGFEVPHTHTFLTLRRYHSANVTITGQSNQVSNGMAARSRAIASFAWTKQPGLEQAAKTANEDVYCRNQMSIDSLSGLLPDYSGTWQIFVPAAALHPVLANANASGGAVKDADLASSVLEAVLEIISGDICTKRSGLNQPMFFRSVPIEGVAAARAVKAAIEGVVGVPVQLNSVRQAQIDRETPFTWKSIEVKSGERVLKSERFDDLSTALENFTKLGDTLLKSSLAVVSDYDDEGEAYYLVSSAIRGYDDIKAFEFDVERRTGVAFQHFAANGVASELTLSARSH